LLLMFWLRSFPLPLQVALLQLVTKCTQNSDVEVCRATFSFWYYLDEQFRYLESE
jgi:hypothetical protein